MLGAAGRPREVFAAYRRSVQLDPENPAVMNNLAFQLASAGGDLEEALTMARMAAQKLPDKPEATDTIGWIYLKKGNIDSALPTFRSVVAKAPTASAFRVRLAGADGEGRPRKRAAGTPDGAPLCLG